MAFVDPFVRLKVKGLWLFFIDLFGKSSQWTDCFISLSLVKSTPGVLEKIMDCLVDKESLISALNGPNMEWNN